MCRSEIDIWCGQKVRAHNENVIDLINLKIEINKVFEIFETKEVNI